MKVRILVGAQAAYACISSDNRTMDVMLSPGMSAVKSMRQSAAEMRKKADDLQERATYIDQAADLHAMEY